MKYCPLIKERGCLPQCVFRINQENELLRLHHPQFDPEQPCGLVSIMWLAPHLWEEGVLRFEHRMAWVEERIRVDPDRFFEECRRRLRKYKKGGDPSPEEDDSP